MGKKLFDFVIGNPPYQEQNDSNGRRDHKAPWHRGMDSTDASDSRPSGEAPEPGALRNGLFHVSP
jgi:hypothetical protein